MSRRTSLVPGASRSVWAATVAGSVLALAFVTRAALISYEWVGTNFPGFWVVGNRLIPSVGLAHWPAAEISDLHWSEVQAVDGQPVSTAADVYEHARRAATGTPVRYTLHTGTGIIERTIPTQRFETYDWIAFFLPFLLNGVMMLACGMIVWVMGPRRPAARALLALGGVGGAFFLSVPELYGATRWAAATHIAEALLPGAVVQLALLFPHVSDYARWRFAGYAVTLFVLAAESVSYSHPLYFIQVVRWNYVATAAAVMILLVRLLLGYRSDNAPVVRQRARLVTIGGGLGIVVPGLVLIATVLTGGHTPTNLAALMPVIFVAAIAYAIVQHDLFEIDAMVKRGAYYLVLTGVVAGVYVAAVLVFHQLLQLGLVGNSPAFPIAFTLSVLLLVNPLRSRLQALVDRLFFGLRYEASEVLAGVGQQLASTLSHDEIVRLVIDAVDRVIPNRHTAIVDEVPAALQAPLRTGRMVTVGDPTDADDGADTSGSARAALIAMDAEIAVPLRQGDALVGILVTGRKTTGVFYTASDAEFLRALAHTAAIALQNSASFEALRRLNDELETRVRNRTAQLVQTEKMAALGRLVAGVAHEINNPVSFVAGTVEPLRQRIARAYDAVPSELKPGLREARDLVEIMSRGAERTAAIVKDLRLFSRAGEESWKAADLQECIEVSARLLQSKWRDRIAIHRQYQPMPALLCDSGQLNQAFMNVIANACEAIAGTGNIWLTTHSNNGTVEISIRDDGCGIAEDLVDRVFDPFFTTKDVGQGTGLGLAITHGIIEAHGGTIAIASVCGKGTTVSIRLPMRGDG